MVVRLWTNSLCLVLVCLSENSKVAFKATNYTEELVFFCAVSNRAGLWQQLHTPFVYQLAIIFWKKNAVACYIRNCMAIQSLVK